MKKAVLFLICTSLYLFSFSQDILKEIKTDINEVTVFLNGAQINRSGKGNLPLGNSQVIFRDLPSVIVPQSVQVSGKGNFTILSVQYQVNYLKEQEITPRMKALNDSLELINDRITNENNLLYVYNAEEGLILANKEMGGANSGVSMVALKEAAEYYRTRLVDIKSKQTQQNKKIKDLNEIKQKISQQLNEENARKNQPSGEILVTVYCTAATAAAFDLSYVVNQAGWYPSYDLRVTDLTKPVDLALKANIHQSSGETWDKVKLTLSTGNPSVDNSKPQLTTWFLRYYYPQTVSYSSDKKTRSAAPAKSAEMAKGEGYAMDEEPASTAANYVATSENPTNFEYTVSIPYTITSTNKETTVEIQKNQLNAIYEYYAAPKIVKDAFLLARVNGWENLNLLNGEINLYYENTYVGISYLNAAISKDTIDFSLGRDKSISIDRKRSKEFSSKKLIGLNQKATIGWDYEMKNKKSTAIKIIIEDQIPVSTDKDLEVTADELSGGQHNINTGFVTWKFDLKPTEAKKFKMIYSVKYPKDKDLILE